MYNFISSKVPYYMSKEIDFDDVTDHLHDFDGVESRLIYDGTGYLNPIISIVIPCYNADLLKVAIESAINQDFQYPYEIVVVDNNSEKKNEIENYILSLNSSLIRYFRNDENIGLFGNWNRCILLARSEFIVYLHADDALVHDTLSKLWRLHGMIEEKAAIIGRFITLGVDNKEVFHYQKRTGIIKSKEYYRISKYGLLYGDSCNGCGALLNKNVMIELGGWNPDYFPGSDRVLFLLYAERYGLYRLNDIVRKETFGISTSSQLFKKYPSVSYYLSRSVILRSFHFKSLWHFFNYHSYIVYNNSRSPWEDKYVQYKVPIISKILDKIYKFPYRFVGKSIKLW